MGSADDNFGALGLPADVGTSIPDAPWNHMLRDKKVVAGVGVALFVMVATIVVTVVCVQFVKQEEKTTLSTELSGTTTIVTTHTTSPGEVFTTVTTYTKGPVFCIYRRFRVLNVDILFSFDCSNVTDDITGTYNGVPDVWLRPDIPSQTAETILPVYVTPDYSGQGAAVQINSTIPYQYIDLVRSPTFYNRTFTISAWIKPNLAGNSITVLLAQDYTNASTFFVGIIYRLPRIRVYNAFLEGNTILKNFQWQYVTYVFAQSDLSMAIYIDGILNEVSMITDPQYGNFTIKETTIGSAGEFARYDGLIDQLSIAYRVKSREEILDEATLVVDYTFEGVTGKSDSLFDDSSANSIRASGSNVTLLMSQRIVGQGILYLTNSDLSWFRSSGFALLGTHNYTYSCVLWIYVTDVSLMMPLIHITARNETSTTNASDSICLAMLVLNKTQTNSQSMQMSLYIYGPTENHIITSNIPIISSKWYHVAVVSRVSTHDLYINGTLVGSSINSVNNTYMVNNEQRLALFIGNPQKQAIDNDNYQSMCPTEAVGTSSNQIRLSIDNIRFYSRPLKAKEIWGLSVDYPVPTKYFYEDT